MYGLLHQRLCCAVVIAMTIIPVDSSPKVEPDELEVIESDHERSCLEDEAKDVDTGKVTTEEKSTGMNGGAQYNSITGKSLEIDSCSV